MMHDPMMRLLEVQEDMREACGTLIEAARTIRTVRQVIDELVSLCDRCLEEPAPDPSRLILTVAALRSDLEFARRLLAEDPPTRATEMRIGLPEARPLRISATPPPALRMFP